jgi:hypothetical protein
VNFLSEKFLELAQSKCHEKNCIAVTSGGFEGENKDKAFDSSPEKGFFVISHLSANHEGDTRVWFHAFKSTANRLIIYSPDTDTFFIGLPPDFFSVLCQIENVSSLSLVNQSCQKYMYHGKLFCNLCPS